MYADAAVRLSLVQPVAWNWLFSPQARYGSKWPVAHASKPTRKTASMETRKVDEVV